MKTNITLEHASRQAGAYDCRCQFCNQKVKSGDVVVKARGYRTGNGYAHLTCINAQAEVMSGRED